MLAIEPEERPTAAQALGHCVFTGARGPTPTHKTKLRSVERSQEELDAVLGLVEVLRRRQLRTATLGKKLPVRSVSDVLGELGIDDADEGKEAMSQGAALSPEQVRLPLSCLARHQCSVCTLAVMMRALRPEQVRLLLWRWCPEPGHVAPASMRFESVCDDDEMCSHICLESICLPSFWSFCCQSPILMLL